MGQSSLKKELDFNTKHNSNDAIFVADTNSGLIVEANKAASNLLKRPIKEIIGMHQSDLHPKEEKKKYQKLFKKHADYEKTITNNAYIENKDGEKILVRIEGSTFRIGEQKFIIGIFHDLSSESNIQKTLIEEKEKSLKYLEIASVMIIAIEKDQKVSLINNKGAEILGYKKEDIIGKNWFDNFLPRRLRKDVKKVFNKLMKGEAKNVEFFENPIINKKGEERIIEWHNSIVKDNEGHITGIISSGQDITEKKIAREKIIESEEKYKLLTENLMDAIFKVSKRGYLEYISPAIESLSGYKPEEIVNTHMSKYFADKKELLEATGLLKKVFKEKTPIRYEFLFRPKDRKPFYVEIIAKPVIEEGKVVSVQGTMRDISERIIADNKIAESEKRFKEILENASDLIQSVDKNGKFVYVNKKWRETIGYTSDEAKKLTFRDIIDPEYISHCELLFNDIRAGKDIGDILTVFRTKKGKKIYVEGKASFQQDEGKFVSTLGIFRDLSDKKRFVQTVKEHNDFLQNIVDSFPFPFYVINVSDYSLRLTNKAAYEINKDPYSKKCYELSHKRKKPCEGKEHVCPLNEILKTKKPVTVEHIHYDKDKKNKTYEIRGYPIFDDRGNVTQIIEASLDISEKKNIERKIEESEKNYRTIFETAANLILSIDKDGKIIDCNSKVKEFLGYDKERLINKPIEMIIRAGCLNEFFRSLKETIKKGFSYNKECIMIKKNKEMVYVKINSSGIKDDKGNFIKTISIIDDITEEKTANEKLEASKKAIEEKMNELEKFTRLTVDRELMMIQLKDRIKEMEKNLKEENKDEKEEIEAAP